MCDASLCSYVLECQPLTDARLPLTTGLHVHAFLHSLAGRCGLSAILHDGPIPRPYTLSPLIGGQEQRKHLIVRRAARCYIRLTLINGRGIWDRLSALLIENSSLVSRLGATEFSLTRLIAPPSLCSPLWVGCTDWEHLAALPPQHQITFSFQTPTAFSEGKKQFALFPEPLRVWNSLLRVWNSYAPEHLHIEKERVRQALVNQEVIVMRCDLQTQTLHYPDYLQKGFLGTCTYYIRSNECVTADFTALAALASYAGLGYKTTMGMGQVHATFSSKETSPSFLEEEAYR